jgi:cellulose synthase/poly-beta-1,6-N-acetylglucosamine synthase-like glycosyltransferase
MKKPSVSVIIPALNEENYIEATLKAVKNQDYDGTYEIIVADGMSKDDTVKVAKKYADKVIIVKKQMAAAERNAGARIAGGDILVFIDADTLVLPNCLSEIFELFKNKEVVGAACPIFLFSSKFTHFIFYWFSNQVVKFSIKTNKPQLLGNFFAFRKDTFEKIHGFNERLYTHEDYDLSERISKFGKIAFTEKTLVLASPRRFEKWGGAKCVRKTITYYLNYLLTGKGAETNKYEPVR